MKKKMKSVFENLASLKEEEAKAYRELVNSVEEDSFMVETDGKNITETFKKEKCFDREPESKKKENIVAFEQLNSIYIAFNIVAGISTILGILGFTVKDIGGNLKWWHCILIIIGLYFLILVIIYWILKAYQHKQYVVKIKRSKN